MLRDAELDALFDDVFSDYEADLSRFPFRAHIFRRRGMFPVEKLEMIYSYRTHATDPDRNIRFHAISASPAKAWSGKRAKTATCGSSAATTWRTQRPRSICAARKTPPRAKSSPSLRCRFGHWPHNATVCRKTAPSAC